MSSEDWEQELDRIMDRVYDWGVEYSKTDHFGRLTEEQKDDSEAIVMFFTEYMFTHHDQTPEEWDENALEECCLYTLPTKVTAEESFFNSISPVLSSFFAFTDERGLLTNSRRLAAKAKETGDRIVKNASDPKYWGPAKSFLMSAMKAGVDLEDEEELNTFLVLHNLQQLSRLVDEGERKPNVGRNDPCPCGSGKKYKRCCLRKEASRHASPSHTIQAECVGDYGEPDLSGDFFERNPFREVSAPCMVYSVLLGADAELRFTSLMRKLTTRSKAEGRRIRRAKDANALMRIMKARPDPLNHPLLIKRLVRRSRKVVPLILEELKVSRDDVFIELAVRTLFRSRTDCSSQLMDMVRKPVRDPYALSLICILLGLKGPRESVRPVWDCYHFLRESFPEEEYSEGPLIGLYELKERFSSLAE